MMDGPNVGLRRQTTRSSDTIKGVDRSRQQDGGHRDELVPQDQPTADWIWWYMCEA